MTSRWSLFLLATALAVQQGLAQQALAQQAPATLVAALHPPLEFVSEHIVYQAEESVARQFANDLRSFIRAASSRLYGW